MATDLSTLVRGVIGPRYRERRGRVSWLVTCLGDEMSRVLFDGEAVNGFMMGSHVAPNEPKTGFVSHVDYWRSRKNFVMAATEQLVKLGLPQSQELYPMSLISIDIAQDGLGRALERYRKGLRGEK